VQRIRVTADDPTIQAPPDASLPCDATSTDPSVTGEPTATSGCDSVGFNVSFSDSSASNSTCARTIVRIWTVTNDCGATATDTQQIVIGGNSSGIVIVPPASPLCIAPASGDLYCFEDAATSDSFVRRIFGIAMCMC
jgi:hypothetical protein